MLFFRLFLRAELPATDLTVIASGFKDFGAGNVVKADSPVDTASEDAAPAPSSAIDDYSALLGIFNDRT